LRETSTIRKCDWCSVAEQHCYGRLEYCNCDCNRIIRKKSQIPNTECKFTKGYCPCHDSSLPNTIRNTCDHCQSTNREVYECFSDGTYYNCNDCQKLTMTDDILCCICYTDCCKHLEVVTHD